MDHLRKFHDVFTFPQNNNNDGHSDGSITLHPSLQSPDNRTAAVGDVIKVLGEELVPRIRNELYPVTASFRMPIFFSLERAAAPYYGIKPHGISCKENLLKECEDEAGIPRAISSTAVPVGAVSYMDINGYSYKRDVLFCYDLELPDGFTPINKDGEVESFKLIPVAQVAKVIRSTEIFKPNCNLVIIDFLFRHGFLTPEGCGYLQLLQSLRSGDCS
ncbi:nudix hydrolase 20, chloroplastic isoform X3 [Cinnamomum micranthum f. kanehirae]|uniref:Nudix hydrolase 20, chloroplastic isoform X3 n=1 Tax=Cinnamomum micranthum f. kanehirae TaxID=337451 RepID=A0A443P1W1_9MAGN|nr:nudix hydrolase 20, chloroplastic isoform X3 [Cinnamomum micranthum f. kanehirae]